MAAAATEHTYYYAATVPLSFRDAEARVREELQKEGFGVLTEIDVQATLASKLGVSFHPYKILGACNPGFAHEALQLEDKVGTMLPCNVILQEKNGSTEIAAVDPVASMASIDNDDLGGIAQQVRGRLRSVVDRVSGFAG